MGISERLRGKRVYFDTNIFIYLLEGNETLHTQIDELKASILEGDCSIFASDIVFTEILPPLVRSGNTEATNKLLEFLQEENAFHLVPLTRDVCIQAGVLRGQTGMKTPDAIHVASAMAENCNTFLTNDTGIQLPKTIERVLFSTP
jgi:predicted nucleic acid-binding protein